MTPMRILLVDDDPSVLQALMAVMKTIPGHEVRLAANAEKALQHAEAMGGVDLLVSDVVMEPTDGFTLRSHLQSAYPEMRVAFISGYDLSDYGEQLNGAQVLAKPIDADALRAVVGESSQPVAAVAAHGSENGATVKAAVPSVNDPLIGVQLGDYRLEQRLGLGVWGPTYLATQLSVNRPVGFKVLDLSAAKEENARRQFLADARAKAAVQHPFIVSVFEADEREGCVFYTHEFLDGATLEELAQLGTRLDEKAALHVMKVVGESLNYLWTNNLAHSPVDSRCIRFGRDGIARVANLATSRPEPNITPVYEIQTVAAIVSHLTPERQSPGLRMLLKRMSGGTHALTTWPEVLQIVKSLEPKVIPVEAAKIKAADEAAQKAVEAARKARRKSMLMQIYTLCLVAILIGASVFYIFFSGKRVLTEQIQIPAGVYPVGPQGASVELGAYDIDKYEVTVGEYAKFIEFCQAQPENEHKYDHPKGDRSVSHVTKDVLVLIANAKASKTVFSNINNSGDPGAAINLDCPMVGVTFWDAYAYAHWKGRDLPTEEEWEAAARGQRGFQYPWGDQVNLKNFNSNAGFVAAQPGGNQTEDKFNFWSPVDKFPEDRSPFKVVGMAGNVAEWVYKKEGANENALVKGGSFATPPLKMSERLTHFVAEDGWYVLSGQRVRLRAGPGSEKETVAVGDAITPSTRSLYIGFRTVKRK